MTHTHTHTHTQTHTNQRVLMAARRKLQSLDMNDLVISILSFSSFYKSLLIFVVVWSKSKFSKTISLFQVFYYCSWVVEAA